MGDSRPPIAETLALALTFGVAAFVPLLALAMALTTPVELPALHTSENQHAETALYLLTFLVVLPGATLAAPRAWALLERGLGRDGASASVAVLAGALLAGLLAVRVLPGDGGIPEVLAVDAVWAAGALVLGRQARRRAAPIRGAERRRVLAWAALGVLALASLLAFTSLGSISLIGLLATAVVAALAVRLCTTRTVGPLPARWGGVADGAVLVALALLIPNLVVFATGAGTSFEAAFDTHIAQFHQDFFLGPVNIVMHGGAVLVDTASQYGVGSIYALAAWFQLAPLGYGPLAFLDGCLYVIYFGAGFLILRFAGVPRPLAAVTLAAAVAVLLYNLQFPVGDLLQHGPLRFGIPMLVILGGVLGARRAEVRGAPFALQCFAVGLASIWALEAFGFTIATFLAMRAFAAWAGDGGRFRRLGRDLAIALAACVGFHLVLVLATVIFRGEVPNWGDYLAFLHQFILGRLGDLTYDFSPWSAGFVVGAACFASAAALLLAIRLRGELVRANLPLMTAVCGTTAFGIVLFSYFVDRSADHILPYVSLPIVLAGALWLTLLLRTRGPAAPATRWALGLGAGAVALAVSVAWSSVGTGVANSPAGQLAPGGRSLTGALHRLWNLPPLDARAPGGQALLARYMPGQERVAVIVAPDLQVEILLRSGRVDSLPFSDPLEDSFVGRRPLGDLGRAVDDLHPGDRVLVQASGLRVIRALRGLPDRDVLAEPIPTADALTGQQEWVLQQLDARFRLRVLHRDAEGYVVLELGPERAST